MRNKLNMIGAVWMVLLVFAALAAPAATVNRLGVRAAADYDANYCIVITDEDLTTSATNTAQVISNLFAVSSNMAVELIAMELETEFSDDATNAFSSVTVTVGDGTDTDYYLTSTELCLHNDPTYVAYPRAPYPGTTSAMLSNVTENTASFIAATPTLLTTTVYVGDVAATNADGVAATVVTGVTWTAANAVTNLTKSTATVMGGTSLTQSRKVYTAADYVDFTFTPVATYGLAALDNGEVRFYFRVYPIR